MGASLRAELEELRKSAQLEAEVHCRSVEERTAQKLSEVVAESDTAVQDVRARLEAVEKLLSAETEKRTAAEALAEIAHGRSQELNAQSDKLLRELAIWKEKVETLNSNTEHIRAEHARLQNLAETTADERRHYKDIAEAAVTENEQLRLDSVDCKASMEAAIVEASELRSDRDRYRESASDAVVEIEKLRLERERSNSIREAASANHERLQSEYARFKETAESTAAELERMRLERDRCEHLAEAATAHVEALRAERDSAIRREKAGEERTNQRLSEVVAESEAAMRDCSKNIREAVSADIERLQSEYARLKEAFASTSVELEQMRLERDRCKSAAEAASADVETMRLERDAANVSAERIEQRLCEVVKDSEASTKDLHSRLQAVENLLSAETVKRTAAEELAEIAKQRLQNQMHNRAACSVSFRGRERKWRL